MVHTTQLNPKAGEKETGQQKVNRDRRKEGRPIVMPDLLEAVGLSHLHAYKTITAPMKQASRATAARPGPAGLPSTELFSSEEVVLVVG